MNTDPLHDLIYDWNLGTERAARPSSKKIEFDDETLRDGLQSPSVTDPSIDEKIRILHFQNDIGVDTSDIGLPGAGVHVQKTVERLAREIVDARLSVKANCAARTHENDIRPIVEISQRVAFHRGLHLHRLLADPAVRGRVGSRLGHRAVGQSGALRGRRRVAGHVRH